MKALKLLKSTLLVVTVLLCLSLQQTVATEEGEYEEDAVVEEDNGETITEKTVSLVEEAPYSSPEPAGHVYFAEHFDNPDVMETKWVKSQAKKEGIDDSIAKYDGSWSVEAAAKDPLNGDLGLIMKSKAKHAAISALLDKPFHFTDKPLIVQYDVTLQNGQECGGAYLKLLQYEQGMRLSQFTDKTPYSIMFGPDKCGNDNKLHFIFQHKNPKNGTVEEKHAKKPSTRLDEYFDKKPHLYRLQVYPDNTFDLSIDYKIVNKGSLLDDMVPPVNPPVEIDDPNDTKPADWDERDKIPDPTATKPEDWDEDAPQEIVDEYAVKPSGWLEEEEPMIPDPTAEKPDDWDEEMDGTWEAPLLENPACASAPGCGKWKAPSIPNPDYRGKWRAPMIDNPNYRGKWRPKRIPNPDFYYDPNPFNMVPIGAVGIELWSMSDNILFDNIIITDDKSVADQWSASTFDIKRERVDSEGDSLVQRVLKYTNKRPWLWAVYVVAVALPVVIVLSLCFGKKEKKAQAAAAAAKKTDASSPDDAIAEEEAEPEGEVDEENSEVDEPEGDEEKALIQEEGADEKAEKQSPRRRKGVRKE